MEESIWSGSWGVVWIGRFQVKSNKDCIEPYFKKL